MQLGWPFPKRIKHLQDLAKTTTGNTRGIRFQSKLQYFQIYGVPVELPKYRLENGRTSAAQVEYLAKHPELAKDFFTKDPESNEAQQKQHEILKLMIDESGLFAYFKTHEQEIPLILSHQGFVVNGNRRLCAMRELFGQDKEEYRKFAHVDVVVLPPCDEKDIDWLEGKEQIQKDITAKYPWYATAIMYKRRMAEHGFTPAELASLYESKEPDITELLDMLAHAELYLTDRGKEGQFSALADHEFAFRQLKKNRPKLKTEPRKEVYEKICYTLIDKPIGERTYQSVADVSKYFDLVVDGIKSELSLSDENAKGANGILGTTDPAISSVVTALDDQSNHDQIRDVIRDVIDAEVEKERGKKKANYVLNQVRKANSTLRDAVAALGKSSMKDGVAEHLDEIDTSLGRIRKWLDGKPQN